jgi:uncharacterized protein YndB with AHSA1/START domain
LYVLRPARHGIENQEQGAAFMKIHLLLLATSCLALSAGVFGEATPTKSGVTVTRTDHPRKRLDFTVDVPASVAEVWKCFSTRAGMVSWITPDAQVELRPGGKWLALFPGAAPGGGTILSFAAEQQLTLHAMAPEQFPTVRKEGTTAVFTFMALDESHTRVHLSQVGWKSGSEWQRAYDHLAAGNAMLLDQLLGRFLHGPINWSKEMK